MPLTSSKYRFRVTAMKQKPTATKDGGGHVDKSDPANVVEYCSRRASVTPAGGQDLLDPDGNRIGSILNHRVQMRYDSVSCKIDSSMWLIWIDPAKGKRILNVMSCFDAEGLRRELTVTCTERIA